MGWLDDLFKWAQGGLGGAVNAGFEGLPDPQGFAPGQAAGTAAPSGFSSINWGEGLKSFGKEVAPGIGAAGAGALIQRMMPGSPGKILSPEARTPEGTSAEALRLKTAGRASQQLESSFTDPYGGLTPEEQARIKKESRSADAARGMLETGGSAVREREALELASRNRQRELYGNVGSLTSGYTPRGVVSVPGEQNPWANILTMALAPAVGKGFGGLINRWWV